MGAARALRSMIAHHFTRLRFQSACGALTTPTPRIARVGERAASACASPTPRSPPPTLCRCPWHVAHAEATCARSTQHERVPLHEAALPTRTQRSDDSYVPHRTRLRTSGLVTLVLRAEPMMPPHDSMLIVVQHQQQA